MEKKESHVYKALARAHAAAATIRDNAKNTTLQSVEAVMQRMVDECKRIDAMKPATRERKAVTSLLTAETPPLLHAYHTSNRSSQQGSSNSRRGPSKKDRWGRGQGR